LKTLNNLSIIATTRCNLACPLCMLQWLMRDRPRYDLPLDELAHFITRCEEMELYFAWAWFTGGEPTLWPHLAEGVKMLSDSPSFGKLRLNTNGANIGALDPIRDKLANVRMSVYHANLEKAKELYPIRAQYKIGFWSEPHRAAPEQPIDGGLPAPCICPIMSYFDRRVYVCPGGYSVAAKTGTPLDDPRYSISVDEDFAVFYEANETKRLNQPLCQSCLSNGVVYQQQESTQETPVDMGAIKVARGRSKA
jgi:hypothetical protein